MKFYLKQIERLLTLCRLNKSPNLKVDFVFSTGTSCRTAQALKRNNLRLQSFPYDWMMGYKITCISDHLKNGFSDFFLETEDLKQNISGKRMVRDLKTGMISMHDFPDDVTIQEFLPEFKQKMQRRYNRLVYNLSTSKSVAIINAGRPDEKSDIDEFLLVLTSLYPKLNIHFINIIHDDFVKKTIVSHLSRFCHYYEIRFSDIYTGGKDHPYAWLGNTDEWDAILRGIKLKEKSPSISTDHSGLPRVKF